MYDAILSSDLHDLVLVLATRFIQRVDGVTIITILLVKLYYRVKKNDKFTITVLVIYFAII
jgi:hypothetical protein